MKNLVAILPTPKLSGEALKKSVQGKTFEEVLAWETSRRAIFFRPLINDLWEEVKQAEKRREAVKKYLWKANQTGEAKEGVLKRAYDAAWKNVHDSRDRLNGILHLSGGMDIWSWERGR